MSLKKYCFKHNDVNSLAIERNCTKFRDLPKFLNLFYLNDSVKRFTLKLLFAKRSLVKLRGYLREIVTIFENTWINTESR